MPREGAPDVLEPPQTVVPHLGRSGARSDQLTARFAEGQPPPQLAREELGLVESPLPLTARVKGHRHHPVCGEALDYEAFRQQQRQRARQTPPSFVLEPLDRKLDRALICDR